MERQLKLVSLADELSALEQAVDGLRLLTEATLVEEVGREQGVARAPVIISTMAALIGARLKLVMRVVAGLADPATIHNRALNDVTGIDRSETTDVILKEWSNEEVAKHCREELERCEKRLKKEGGKR